MGKVSYKLALPPHLSQVHPVFHISLLRKYVPNEMHVLPVQEILIRDDLSYEEQPVAIVDRQIRKLRRREIVMLKIQWQRHILEECTWESEQAMKEKYPQLFQ